MPAQSATPILPADGQLRLSTLALIRSDIRAMVPELKSGGIRSVASAGIKLLLYPRIRAVIYYRLSHALFRRRWVLTAYWFQQLGIKAAGTEIHPGAVIGPSFCLFHSSGVVIGNQVTIGPNFRCFQGVTIGDAGLGENAPAGQPTLGDGVTLYAGAKVIGPIHVGDRAVVGANAVLMIDVPADGVAVGIPARVLPRREA